MTNSNQPLSYTAGAKRPVRKQLWFDSIARALITSGGVGTILVALLIVVVMVSQLLPLLSTTEVTTVAEFEIDGDNETRAEHTASSDRSLITPICAGMDEYGDIAWFLLPSGTIDIYATSTGMRLQSFAPADKELDGENLLKPEITACSVADDDASLLLGYSNGEVRPVTIRWTVEYLDTAIHDGNEQKRLNGSESDQSVFTELPNGLVRVQRIDRVDYHEPIPVLKHPVRCVDWLTPEAIYGLEKIKSWKWLASDGHEIVVQHHLRRRQGISLSIKEEIKTWRTETAIDSISHAMLNAQGEGLTTISPN
nr:hypothetical protein [Pirellula sp.]